MALSSASHSGGWGGFWVLGLPEPALARGRLWAASPCPWQTAPGPRQSEGTWPDLQHVVALLEVVHGLDVVGLGVQEDHLRRPPVHPLEDVRRVHNRGAAQRALVVQELQELLALDDVKVRGDLRWGAAQARYFRGFLQGFWPLAPSLCK